MLATLRRLLQSSESRCREYLDTLIDEETPRLPPRARPPHWVEYSRPDQQDPRQLQHVEFRAACTHEPLPAWIDACSRLCRQIARCQIETVAIPITAITCVRASKSHGHGTILDAGSAADLPDLRRFGSPDLQFEHCFHHAFGVAAKSQQFTRLGWNGVLSWQNSDGSHHLARAIWLAHQHGLRATISGTCSNWEIDEDVLTQAQVHFGLCVVASRITYRIDPYRSAPLPHLARAFWRCSNDQGPETYLIARDPSSPHRHVFDQWIGNLVRQGLARTLVAELNLHR